MKIITIYSYDEFEKYLHNNKYIVFNVSASWCAPCKAIKPQIEKFISVIQTTNCIYLKIDHDIYENDSRFEDVFIIKKIPYFGFIIQSKLVDAHVSGDYLYISKKIFEFVSIEKKESGQNIEQDIEQINTDVKNDFSLDDNF